MVHDRSNAFSVSHTLVIVHHIIKLKCFHVGYMQQQPSQVGSLFTFLARQGARYRTSIRVDEHVYDQVAVD